MKYGMIFALAGALAGQQLDLSSLDKLGAKAQEQTTINMDAERLKMAAGLLANDQAKGKNFSDVASSLKGLIVRSFEFDGSGRYAMSDLDAVRAQLKPPNWSRVVEVREKDESMEIWFYSEGGKNGGMALLAAEPDELTVINIIGAADLSALGALRGLPNLQLLHGAPSKKPAPPPPPPPPPPAKKDRDEE
jgi:hypothetical protein